MILHALELTARDLGIGVLSSCAVTVVLIVVVVIGRALIRRADARYVREVERERSRQRLQLHADERRRSEMRSFNARPTSDERWGGVV